MAYKRLNLKNGTVIEEGHIKHIEDGIEENSKKHSVSSGRVVASESADGSKTYNLVLTMDDESVVTIPLAELWEELDNEQTIQLLENNDSSNRIPLRTIASGMYILKGAFTSYHGATDKYTFSTGMLVSVVNSGTITYVQIFYAKYNTLQYLEITDNSVTRKDAQLVNMESTANKVVSITETATDTQYPSAKAVREFVENSGSGEIDATLTQSGKAAEAKATGDAFENLSEAKADKSGWGSNKYLGTDADGNMVEKEAPQIGTGVITEETDPTVPSWAKQAQKPTYTASEVGALPASTKIPGKTSDLTNDSGYITIAVATLLNYYLKTETYAKTETYSQTEVDNLISGLDKRLNAIADSEDVDLDQLSEIVAYIKSNKSLIDSITTSKVNVSDIVDNLTTVDSKKPLSAAQGKVLKALYDALPAWAKAAEKPTYSKSEVGLGNVDNVRQYSASNPPPYPVTSVNGKTGAVKLGASDVGALPAETKISGVDDTLKVSGAAADAKVVGERLAEISGEIADKVDNPLYGKKVSFNGDSLCNGGSEGSYLGGYGKIIADRNNMTYQNISKGGATITAELYSSSTGNPYHWISRTIANMDADSDYAIIEGGVNDAWKPAPIGEMSVGYDAVLDDSTYYGAFESMCKQLITRFAGKKIGYIAPPKMAPQFDSRNENDYYHIALECCEKWGVPVCDLNTGIPPLSYVDALSDVYTVDGTHPTEEGYKKYYCDPIEEWMRNLTVCGKSAAHAVKKHNADTTAHPDIRALITALQNGKLNSNGISIKKARLPLADGTTVDVDVLVASDGVIVIPFTNQIPFAVDTDKASIFGDDYDGDGKKDGYLNGYRLNSSGATKAQTASLGSFVTGFIKAEPGDTIHISGIPFFRSDSNDASNGAGNYLWSYDNNLNPLGCVCGNEIYYGTWTDDTSLRPVCSYIIDNGTTTINECTITLNNTEAIAYIRLSCYSGTQYTDVVSDGATAIITVNEDIS